MIAPVTAIIPHYWDSRGASLPQIVEALRSGECAPEQVIIWNNTPKLYFCQGADVINAERNWGITARFAAAYLARTEYVLFQDNDLLVQPGTLKNLTRSLPPFGESVELQGRTFGPPDAPYSNSCYYQNVDRLVDVGLSRLSLMRRGTAMRLASAIPPEAVDDDIWVSRHCTIRLIPFEADEGFTNLPETEGLSLDAVAHVGRRDVLIKQLWRGRAGFAC